MNKQLGVRHLDELSRRAGESRRELLLAREDVALLQEKAKDLRIRMFLAGTPVGWRELRTAHENLRFLQEEIAEAENDLADLDNQRARIMERLTR